MAIQDKDIKKFKLDMDKSRLYIERIVLESLVTWGISQNQNKVLQGN